MLPHESWIATELCLGAFFIALVVIALVCVDAARVPDDLDLDDNGPGGTG
ncbi:MAG: hypothetical protein JNK93_10105 [Planctomycetia bacterium]|nr:hypothetical protein [Planctomycetia bacterium]